MPLIADRECTIHADERASERDNRATKNGRKKLHSHLDNVYVFFSPSRLAIPETGAV